MAAPPREFLGKARAFYRLVLKSDAALDPMVDKIHALVTPRLERKPTLRPEMVGAVKRLWQAESSPAFRIALRIEHPNHNPRKGLRIREIRLICLHAKEPHWDDEELNLAVAHVDLKVDAQKGLFNFDTEPLVQVSLHALGRRYERGRDKSDEAVFRDLAALARPGIFEATDRVAVASGVWLGRRREFDLVDHDEQPVRQADLLTVRTFYDNDMPDAKLAPP